MIIPFSVSVFLSAYFLCRCSRLSRSAALFYSSLSMLCSTVIRYDALVNELGAAPGEAGLPALASPTSRIVAHPTRADQVGSSHNNPSSSRAAALLSMASRARSYVPLPTFRFRSCTLTPHTHCLLFLHPILFPHTLCSSVCLRRISNLTRTGNITINVERAHYSLYAQRRPALGRARRHRPRRHRLHAPRLPRPRGPAECPREREHALPRYAARRLAALWL